MGRRQGGGEERKKGEEEQREKENRGMEGEAWRRGVREGGQGGKEKEKVGNRKSDAPYLTSDPSPHIHHLHNMGDNICFCEVVEGTAGCTFDSLDQAYVLVLCEQH